MKLDLAEDRWPDDPDECLLFELPFVARLPDGTVIEGPKCIRHYRDADGWWAKTQDGRAAVTLPKCIGEIK